MKSFYTLVLSFNKTDCYLCQCTSSILKNINLKKATFIRDKRATIPYIFCSKSGEETDATVKKIGVENILKEVRMLTATDAVNRECVRFYSV